MLPILILSSAKRISTRNIAIAKLNRRKYFFERLCLRCHPSFQGTTCLATEAQELGVKTVQD